MEKIIEMPKTSESALLAQSKYKRANIVNVALQFNKKTDPDLTNFVRSLPNKTGFIKSLLREQMGVGATHYVLCINDEDDIRHLQLSSVTAEDALIEAKRIVELFDGLLKGRVDKHDWHIIKGEVDETSPTGLVDDDDSKPIYLYRG